MRVSVIIPLYNAADFLGYTLESVLAQTYSDWELLLVDDGSKDDTLSVASEYAHRDLRIKVIAQPNAGVAAARNTGLAATDPHSEFAVFLDHDDLWRVDAIQTLVTALEANPEAVGAHGMALLVEGAALERGFQSRDGRRVDWRRRKIVRRFGLPRVVECTRNEPTTFAVQVYDGCICTPGLMLIRKSALAKAGRFDGAISPCDDWDMWVRLSLQGDIVFVDEILLNWRLHGGNASLKAGAMAAGVSRSRRKMFVLPGMTADQRHLAHWRYRRMYASVVRHNAVDRLHWARENGRQGLWGAVLRQFTQALGLYGSYVVLSLFWSGLTDRGPIPARLKDSRAILEESLDTPASQRCDPVL